MNSLWDTRIFLGLVPKESPCILKKNFTALIWNPRRSVSSGVPLWDPQTSQHRVLVVLVQCLDAHDVAAVFQGWTHSLSWPPPACIVRQAVVSHIAAGGKDFCLKCCLPAVLVALSVNKHVVWLTDPWTEVYELRTHPVHTVCHCQRADMRTVHGTCSEQHATASAPPSLPFNHI